MKKDRTLIKRFLIEHNKEIYIQYEYSNGDKEVYPLEQIVKVEKETPIVCSHKTTQVIPPFKKQSLSEETTKKYKNNN